LLFPPYQSSLPKNLTQGGSIFSRLQQGDVLIHQPFESFDGVLAFLKEAVEDPNVLAIKQTIYRTGSDPAMMNLLREAVRRGKEVTAVVELKARFDEEANINWAEQLESVGAQVVYGVVGLKTHAKMLLVTRREGRVLKRYGHLSTGNYNPRTAKLYTDLSYLTCDARMTADMDTLFVHLASPSRLGRMNKLWAAPFLLQKKMLEKILSVGAAAEKGQPARIVAKMNSLTDPVLIQALISAGQKGAQIDLIIRGACMLPAGLSGKTDNIRVRSIIGRFLEHSRVFFFEAGDVQDIYLSSADWMTRNMTRRIELAWPVLDLELRQRIVDECLLAYLHDTRNAWTLGADGRYARVDKKGQKKQSAQALLMHKYSAGNVKSR
jgi:polyphosphate kinase